MTPDERKHKADHMARIRREDDRSGRPITAFEAIAWGRALYPDWRWASEAAWFRNVWDGRLVRYTDLLSDVVLETYQGPRLAN